MTMKTIIKFATMMTLGIIVAESAFGQGAKFVGVSVQGGLQQVNTNRFRTQVFPSLESWELQENEAREMQSFSALIHFEDKFFDFGAYTTWGQIAYEGSPQFQMSSVSGATQIYQGQSRIAMERFIYGVHFGVDLIPLLSGKERSELNFEWVFRARWGGGPSVITSKMNRYSHIVGAPEIRSNRSITWVGDTRADMEFAVKIASRVRLGAYGGYTYSIASGHKKDLITRSARDYGERVQFNFSGFGAGVILGVQF